MILNGKIFKLLKKSGFQQCFQNCHRFYSSKNKAVILGIETSCDDTGCAIMNQDGTILGEAIHSQLLIHLRNGGVIPPVAQDLHRANIEHVVSECFEKAQVSWRDIDAVAVTVKPGLPLSLAVGFKYAKYLCKTNSKPLIPIHHMRAHALTARIENDIPFPFLCLLISGGHCLLALVEDVDQFKLLGESIDDSPGETFDKAARRLKLSNLEEFCKLSGGHAIEMAARKSEDPRRFEFAGIMTKLRDCHFSMSGFKSQLMRHINRIEKKFEIEGDAIIPNVYDICAGLQMYIARHLCHRTLRAMYYIEQENLIPEANRTLVVSGGVACNNYIFNALSIPCQETNFRLIRPAPKLCTDNGIMIAWNGIEKWKKNLDIMHDFSSIKAESKSPIGVNISDQVIAKDIRCLQIPMKQLVELNEKMKVVHLESKTEFGRVRV